jgi:hypothetical protein
MSMKLYVAGVALTIVVCGCGSKAASPSLSLPTSQAPAASHDPSKPAPSAKANTATLDYTAPTGHKPQHVSITVTGQAVQHLDALLTGLPTTSPDTMQCALATGEESAITMTVGGHQLVYTVPGVACRNVTVTSDGKPQPARTNSDALIADLRNIASF